jgi:hypothetical protein
MDDPAAPADGLSVHAVALAFAPQITLEHRFGASSNS